MRIAVWVAALGLITVPFAANADTISIITNHFNEDVAYSGGSIYSTESLVFFDPGFDTALGTLTGVTVTINGTLFVNYPFPSLPSGIFGSYSFPETISTYAFLTPNLDEAFGADATPIVTLPVETETSLSPLVMVPVSFTATPPLPLSDYTNGVGNDPSLLTAVETAYPPLLGSLFGDTNLVATFVDFAPVRSDTYFGPLQDDISLGFSGTLTENFTFTVSEPASVSLLGIGVFGLLAGHLIMGRRSRRAASSLDGPVS